MTRELLKEQFMPLKQAISADRVDEVSATLDTHPELLHLGTPLGGWLHIAVDANAVQCVGELLRRGADVNRHYNSALGGALNVACSCGNTVLVKLLLEAGAVPETGHTDYNPLFSAVRSERPDIAQLLLDAGLDPAVDYGNGWTARTFAERMGKSVMADWIRLAGG